MTATTRRGPGTPPRPSHTEALHSALNGHKRTSQLELAGSTALFDTDAIAATIYQTLTDTESQIVAEKLLKFARNERARRARWSA